MALDRGGQLALALGGRLLVVLARAELGQQTGFLHRALEAPQRGLERLVFLDPDSRHVASDEFGKRVLYQAPRHFARLSWMLVLGIETSCDETGVALYE